MSEGYEDGEGFSGTLEHMHVEPWAGPLAMCRGCGVKVEPQYVELVLEDGLCEDCWFPTQVSNG